MNNKIKIYYWVFKNPHLAWTDDFIDDLKYAIVNNIKMNTNDIGYAIKLYIGGYVNHKIKKPPYSKEYFKRK